MSQNYSPSVSSYDRPETPKYHSEPLTRKVGGWWYVTSAQTIKGTEQDTQVREDWAEIEAYDCPKEKLHYYFGSLSATFIFLGLISAIASFSSVVLTMFLWEFSWWNAAPFVLSSILFSIGISNHQEARKTKDSESYMGYFDGQKLCLAIILGVLAVAIFCLGLSLFLVDPIWLEA